MTVEYKTGNIFDSGARVLVNPVNCVGVMGKGLALEFKKRFPWIMSEYEGLCRDHALKPGDIWPTWESEGLCPLPDEVSILLFATKDHWRNHSKLEWVENGLATMVAIIDPEVGSIALPWLGCGLGGLHKDDVRELYDRILGPIELKATVYTPE